MCIFCDACANLNSGQNKIYGTKDVDLLIGNSLADCITGKAGNDSLSGHEGDDTIYGNEGDDTILGGLGNDYLVGDSVLDISIDTSNDTLRGGAGNDTLFGGTGNDELFGGASNDDLYGGNGQDFLVGDIGNDLLIGGSDADQFGFVGGGNFASAILGVDTISDFGNGEDQILLAKTVFQGLSSSADDVINQNEFAVVIDDATAMNREEIIVYSKSTGNLFYNENGTANGFGEGGQFATLEGEPELIAEDIILV